MSEQIFNEQGRIVKMEVDYTSTVDDKIPVCERLAKVRIAFFVSLFVLTTV